MRKLLVSLTFLLAGCATVLAQNIDIDDLLSRYTGANGDLFMQPLGDALGANLNTGLFHGAYIQSGLKPQIYFGLSTMTAVIPETSRVFTAVTEGNFFPTTTVEGVPTIFGDVNGAVADGPAGTSYFFPGGLDLHYLPIACPQLSVGSVFGTDLTIRYAPIGSLMKSFGLEDVDLVNKMNIFGWGIRHNVSQWLGDLAKFDISLGYYQNSFSSRDYIVVKSSLISLQASYNQRLLTIYGGLGIESSSMKIHYQSDENDMLIDYDLEGADKLRLTIGACLNAGPVKLYADYNVAQTISTISVGLGIGINELEKTETQEEW